MLTNSTSETETYNPESRLTLAWLVVSQLPTDDVESIEDLCDQADRYLERGDRTAGEMLLQRAEYLLSRAVERADPETTSMVREIRSSWMQEQTPRAAAPNPTLSLLALAEATQYEDSVLEPATEPKSFAKSAR